MFKQDGNFWTALIRVHIEKWKQNVSYAICHVKNIRKTYTILIWKVEYTCEKKVLEQQMCLISARHIKFLIWLYVAFSTIPRIEHFRCQNFF